MTDKMTQAMQRYQALTLDKGEIQVKGAGEIILLADYLVVHGLSFGHNHHTAVGAITKALELGRSPTWGLQWIAMVRDRPCIWGAGLLGLAREMPVCGGILAGAYTAPEVAKFVAREVAGTGPGAEMRRALQEELAIRLEAMPEAGRRQADYVIGYAATIREGLVSVSLFDIIEARQAGLAGKGGGMYEKYPRRMLRSRAVGYLVRDVYPECMVGAQTAEEALEEPIDTTATVREAAPTRTVEDILPKRPPPVDVEVVVEAKPEAPPIDTTPEPEPPPRPASDKALTKRLTTIKERLHADGIEPKAALLAKAGGRKWSELTAVEREQLAASMERELGIAEQPAS